MTRTFALLAALGAASCMSPPPRAPYPDVIWVGEDCVPRDQPGGSPVVGLHALGPNMTSKGPRRDHTEFYADAHLLVNDDSPDAVLRWYQDRGVRLLVRGETWRILRLQAGDYGLFVGGE